MLSYIQEKWFFMSYRSKTLSLQRAYFNEGFNSTLETVLRNAFSSLPSAKDRIVEIDLFASQLFASFEGARGGEGIFVRVLEFERGAIGVINLDTTDNSAAVEEFFHPRKQDFLKDEIVFYVVRNHIVACNVKNKHGTFASNMLQLAQRADVLGNEVKMKIADVPDQTTLARIEEVGVKEVDFSITSFMENLNISTRQQAGSRIMQMIFGMPADDAGLRKRANAMGRLVLKRGRFTKDEIQKDQWLTNIGKELMIAGSSDNFTIILEDKTKVSNSMLKKTKTVNLRRHANSFSFDHAKMELEAYYRELTADSSLGT
ncbi:hypothetical protein [Roseinatronobacter alkalisoli]|uniref:DUF4868 domain-containing protein n=1 Tax=Roseinatronobacter alkalisoli TaxID=3028235 RepID=A0ABT5TDJ1_9RHOB|nr:hypothetical protein [Roseinatronobacter sp. HJB301]MDD7973192.1 hypothetical protein [Roseinatronobacter sp. HJB301]